MNANKKKLLLAAGALVLVIAAMLGIWLASRPETQQGSKALTVLVIHGDKSEKKFEVRTDEEFLGPVLVKEGIVVDNQDQYGLFMLTVDGETIDSAKQQWWCVTKGGADVMTGADQTPIADGDTFELTFTTGYGF